MQPRKRADSNLLNHSYAQPEFNDKNMQQLPLKLPRITMAHATRQSSKVKNRNIEAFPKLKHNNQSEIDSLDGSQNLNQSQNYANSSDNMMNMINNIKSKFNHSKYSDKFIQSSSSRQQTRQKHSGSSNYIRNEKLFKRQNNKGSIDVNRSKLLSQKNNQDNKSLATENKFDSDISDFEQKIQANRVLIKNNKFIKKPNVKNIGNKINLLEKRSINQNQALYSKRMNDYKNLSENKYLKEKKKQINQIGLIDLKLLRQKQSQFKVKQKQRSKDIHISQISRNQSPIGYNLKREKNKKVSLTKRRKSKLKQQILDDQNSGHYISQSLFSDINKILGKKQKSRSQFLSISKLSRLSANLSAKQSTKLNLNIQQLQKSFRMLEQQQSKLLGFKKDPQNLKVQINKSLIQPSNIYEWKRLSVSKLKNHQINIINSNFTQEVDRINDYHLKNEQSLEVYLANKQLLIQLQLQNKLKQLSPMKAKTNGLEDSRLDYE